MKKYLTFIILSFGALFSNLIAQTVTVTQVDTFAITGLPDQPILKVVIDAGSNTSLSLERLVVYSTSEDSLDISKVRLYKTTGHRFSKSDYPTEYNAVTAMGEKLLKDSAVFSGLTYPLSTGINIIWVVYDLSSVSKAGHVLDAFIKAGGITISGVKYPGTIASPAGEILIRQKYFVDNFEKRDNSTHKPLNWTVSGDENAVWKSEIGGYEGNPSSAKSGSLNARSYAENPAGRVSRLISKPLNLALSVKPQLSFYHAQMYRPVTDKTDSLGLYYGFSTSGPWKFIKNWTLATPDGMWIKREVNLPDEVVNNNVYLAFKSTAQWGFGVCVDSVIIYEAFESARTIYSITSDQTNTKIAPQGSTDNAVMRFNIGVRGNTGTLNFQSVTITSLNTLDNDISSVKLYYTDDSVFIKPTFIKSGNFVGGKVVFNGFTRKLESGNNYYWITYDIKENATPDNFIDAKVSIGDIGVSDGLTYPSVELSPAGNRQIKQSIFFDNFETDKGWIYEGEFQRGQPQGKGGVAFGLRDPSYAYSQTNVIGTDLGLLSNTGDYGKGSRDLATTPLISSKYFKNTALSFARWLNAENQDSAVVEYQLEGETKWNTLWDTQSTIIEGSWSIFNQSTKSIFDRKNFKIRFRLGRSNILEEYSGWNVDDFFLTGDSIKYDAAITDYLGPFSACGLTNGEQIKVRVKNAGPKTLSNIPIKLSLDGGKSWISEVIPGNLLVDNSVIHQFQSVNLSKPAIYDIRIKVEYPGDNFFDNDSISYKLVSVPTYSIPFKDGFEQDTSFWLVGGIVPSWVRGKPSGVGFNTPYDGAKSWKTDLNSGYHSRYENSYIESPCFNLSDAEIPVVDLHYRYYLTQSKKSGARLEYSLDGGNTYSYVPEDSYTFLWNWYNDSVTTFHDKRLGWTNKSLSGAEMVWLNGKQVLPTETANESLVRFRIHFKADSSITAAPDPGFAFDDFKLFNAPDNAGVISIDDFIIPACQYQNSDKLKVTVQNFGLRKIRQNDTIVVGIKIGTNPTVKDTFKLTSDLNVGATRQFTMTKPVDISAPGVYDIKAFVVEKYPSYYGFGYDKDTTVLNITVYPNPITNLPDTIYTARRDTLVVRAVQDPDYLYAWKFGATPVSSTYELDASTTGFGSHSLIVENNISHCITKDTVFIKSLIPDIGVESILSPSTNCGYKTPTRPIIRIKNYGTDTMRVNQVIPVRLRLNKETVLSENIVLNVKFAPGSVYETTLTSTLNLLDARTDTLKIWTELLADDTLRNDTSTLIFQIHGYPDVSLGNDLTVTGQLTYELDAQAGYKTYLWSDGVTATQKFTIYQPGEYSVTVTDANDCPNSDTIYVFLKIHDLAMQTLVSPTDACTQSSATTIRCQLKNNGTDTIQTDEPIILYYQVDGGDIFQDTIKAGARTMLKPNDVYEYTFKHTYDMSAVNTYAFKVKTVLTGDIQPVNDSLLLDVKVFGNPHIDLGENRIERALTYTIDPGEFAEYLWQDGSTESTWEISKLKFEENDRYHLTVTDDNGCTDRDTVTIFLMVDDLEVTNLELPSSICSLSDKENLNIEITNVGNTFLNRKISVSYILNGGGIVSDTMTFYGAEGTSMKHTFTSTANMSGKGVYNFKTEVDMTGDVQSTNDTLTFSTSVLGFPNITFNTPNDTLIVELPYTLSVDNSYSDYKWQDGTAGAEYLITNENYDPSKAEYTVIVTDTNGCNVTESVKVIEAVYDLTINSINIPSSNCTIPSGTKLVVKIKNNSTVNLTDKNIGVKYVIDNGTEVIKEPTISLSKGAVTDIGFDQDIDLPVGNHTIAVTLTYNEDENLADNVSTFDIVVHGNPAFGFAADTIRTSSFPYTLDAGADYQTYKWNDNSADRNLNAAAEGWYILEVTDVNTCSAKDSVYLLNTTGLDDLNDIADIKLFPNPVSNYLTVIINMDKKEDLNLDIISTEGKVVFRKVLSNMDEYREDIDVSGLPKGMYYVRIYSKNSVANKKIVVK